VAEPILTELAKRLSKRKRMLDNISFLISSPSLSHNKINHNVICRLCKGQGHFMRECPYQKVPNQPKPNHGGKSVAQVNAIGDGSGGLIHIECHNGGRVYDGMLDCGATLNLVNMKMAKEMEGTIERKEQTLRAMGHEQRISEIITMKIIVNCKEYTITAGICEDIPADILLGSPFLAEYSKGYEMMVQEFGGKCNPQSVNAVSKTDELQKLLEKYPKLVLGEDEMPAPDRFFKGRSFELGIPEEKRKEVFYRPQYPCDPAMVDEFRKVVDPLIQAGIFKESNSPHNNPVMLVPKKKPGQYRLVIDFRQVNAICKPVGAMRASPLDVIRAISGAVIFTTLDCKNAFYSIPLVEKDWSFTSFTIPGKGKLEMTRMPMGAKASTSALYQAMIAAIGDAYYKNTLVWADDIIIYSKNLEEHIRHVDTILQRLDTSGFCISRNKIELGVSQVK